MSETKLKPCPFCGGKVYLDREEIFCDNCDLHMSIYSKLTNGEAESYEEARGQTIEAWNTREPIEQLNRSLEHYKGFLNDMSYPEMALGVQRAIDVFKVWQERTNKEVG